jgi:hypothetical protein
MNAHALRVKPKQKAEAAGYNFNIDTTFVLFFLALEFGRAGLSLEIDSIFLGLTLAMFLVLPYFLPSEDKADFGSWLAGRAAITAFAMGLGWVFQQSLGVALPEMFRFLPMTLFLVTGISVTLMQFYGLAFLTSLKK